MVMEKYHLAYQELSLKELYLVMKISLGEQTSNDLVDAKLNEIIIYIGQKDQLLRGKVYVEANYGQSYLKT